MKFIDLTGQIFVRLTVIERCGSNSENQPKWKCRCICGKEKIVNGRDLREGATKSCGCYEKDLFIKRFTKHGKTNTPEYVSWVGMKDRCSPTNVAKRKWYYDMGITVCERWANSFENFLSDMGKKPTLKHSIDRFPNKNGNYEPNNCRWATQKQQCGNTKSNRIIEYEGQSKIITEWASMLGVSPSNLNRSLKNKSFDEIIRKVNPYLFQTQFPDPSGTIDND